MQESPAAVPPYFGSAACKTTKLELAGRVALHGRLLADDDTARRVEWQAMTRKKFRTVHVHRYTEMVDEHVVARLNRLAALRDFVRAVAGGCL